MNIYVKLVSTLCHAVCQCHLSLKFSSVEEKSLILEEQGARRREDNNYPSQLAHPSSLPNGDQENKVLGIVQGFIE